MRFLVIPPVALALMYAWTLYLARATHAVVVPEFATLMAAFTLTVIGCVLILVAAVVLLVVL